MPVNCPSCGAALSQLSSRCFSRGCGYVRGCAWSERLQAGSAAAEAASWAHVERLLLPDGWHGKTWDKWPKDAQVQACELLVSSIDNGARTLYPKAIATWTYRVIGGRQLNVGQWGTHLHRIARHSVTEHSLLLFRLALSSHPSAVELRLHHCIHLANSEQWLAAIDAVEAGIDLRPDSQTLAALLRVRIHAYALGNAPERALEDLTIIRQLVGLSDGEQVLYGDLLEEVSGLSLAAGRGFPENPIRVFGRGMTRIGQELGESLGGGSTEVPHDPSKIKSAPRLLCPSEMIGIGNERAGHALEAYLSRSGRIPPEILASGVVGAHGLYVMGGMNPEVLSTITRVGVADPTSLMDMAAEGSKYVDAVGKAQVGHLSRLQGHVAETAVMGHMAANGHDVSLNLNPNHPGSDLILDGFPVQVKNTLNPGHIRAHFERYPDIPVITNTEMGGHFVNDPRVTIDPALHHGDVVEETKRTLSSLDSAGDWGFTFPWMILALSAFRNVREVQLGSATNSEAGTRIVAETFFCGFGGAAGFKGGAMLGWWMGGAAGASVLGIVSGFVGAGAGHAIATGLTRREAVIARNHAVAKLEEYAIWFRHEVLEVRIAQAALAQVRFVEWAAETRLSEFPSLVADQVEQLATETYRRATELRDWLDRELTGGDFGCAHAGWVALAHAPMVFHPEICERLGRVESAIGEYQRAIGSANVEDVIDEL
jgi:hypothetical protein